MTFVKGHNFGSELGVFMHNPRRVAGPQNKTEYMPLIVESRLCIRVGKARKFDGAYTVLGVDALEMQYSTSSSMTNEALFFADAVPEYYALHVDGFVQLRILILTPYPLRIF